MGLSVPHLLVVLAIVVLVFGAGRLKNVGSDLGHAILGFRKAMAEAEDAGQDSKKSLAELKGNADGTV